MPDLPSSLRELIDGAAPAIDVDAVVRGRRRRRLRRRGAIAGTLVVVVADRDHRCGHTTGRRIGMSSRCRATSPRRPRRNTRLDDGDASFRRAAGRACSPVPPTRSRSPTRRRVRRASAAFPIRGAKSIDDPFLSVGSTVVMTVDTQTGPYDAAIGTAYAASPDLRQWRALAPASGVSASAEPGRVRLVSDNATPDQRLHGVEYGAQRSASDVGIDGNDRSESYPLTDHRSVVADTGAGLLTTWPAATKSAPPVYEVWDPATNRVLRRLAIGGYAFSSSSRFVAWTAQSCRPLKPCALHLTDVRTGADRAVAPPAGLLWGDATFSPDGSHVVVVAARPPTRKEIESTSLVVPPGRARRHAGRDRHRHRRGDRSCRHGLEGRAEPELVRGRSAGVLRARPRSLRLFRHVVRAGTAGPRDRRDGCPRVSGGANAGGAERGCPRYTYDGLVQAEPTHAAELCVYATRLMPDDDLCSGPLIAGWDPKTANGKYHLVGTYDGHVFTLTQPPSAAQRGPSAGLPSYKTPCAPPPGGWHATNPALVSFDDYNAFTNAARHDPEFAGPVDRPIDRIGRASPTTSSTTCSTSGSRTPRRASHAARATLGRVDLSDARGAVLRVEHMSMKLVGATGGLRTAGLSGGPDDVAMSCR